MSALSVEEISVHLLECLNSSKNSTFNTEQLKAEYQSIDPALVHGALLSLESRSMIEFSPIITEQWTLTQEGIDVAKNGSHEAKVFYSIPSNETGIPRSALSTLLGDKILQLGQNKAFQLKWISKHPQGNFVRMVDTIIDQTQLDCQSILQTGKSKTDLSRLIELKKRKLCEQTKITHYIISKGPNYATTIKKQATDLTMDMILSGLWKNLEFKSYNFNALGLHVTQGHLHPLMKVREEFRQIFFQMGFQEMPTNCYVESSFWNFDALFQPQQHPARDMHDTFFLSQPATANPYPEETMIAVKQVHSAGGYGSIGYGYNWQESEAKKLLLRTHTTAVSSFMLYQLANQRGGFQPVKLFSIDRVFRNETVDATHLAEFHQVEGVIADRFLTLGNLIGFLDLFFKKMGVTQLRYKPAYNPYTEPSLEIFSYHQGLDEWVEIGNSGMFRPEMLLPLGIPEDVRVIAWGLSLERPTMIKYGINNIRDLLGHKCDFDLVHRNPICRLDKLMGTQKE